MKFSKTFFKNILIDKIKLKLKGGDGANGAPKYHGKGGNGGNVILVGHSKTNLESIREAYPGFHIKASNGQEPKRNCIIGTSGDDIFVNVPTGIDISLDSDDILGTIVNQNDKMLVCRGGIGGGPFNKYLAEPGETVSVVLNMKLIADVGLIGFPNAGKSSLLKAISGISAKIANYAFTTLKPQIATVKYDDDRSISMADLPGIIEGAHVNVGLGHHFLKHLERTKIHLFVIDLHGFKLNSKRLITSYRSPIETILLLFQELERFNPCLMDKKAICVLNKVDKTEGPLIAEFVMEQLSKTDLSQWMDADICPSRIVTFDRVVPISAATGHGIEELKVLIRDMLDKVALEAAEQEFDAARLDKEFEEQMHSLV